MAAELSLALGVQQRQPRESAEIQNGQFSGLNARLSCAWLLLPTLVGILIGSDQIMEARVQASAEKPHQQRPSRIVLASLDVAHLTLVHVGTTGYLDLLQATFLSKRLQG